MQSHLKILQTFWNELKRRKVIRVVTMYAGSAFVIIEFIITVVDLTPGGMKKTETLEEAETEKGISRSERRRLRASDIIIAFLVVALRNYQSMYEVLGKKEEINPRTLSPSLINVVADKLDNRTFILGNIPKAEILELCPEFWPSLEAKGRGLCKLGKHDEALIPLYDTWDFRSTCSHTGFLSIEEVEKAVVIQGSQT